jgi:Tannase and feruloyl esterase
MHRHQSGILDRLSGLKARGAKLILWNGTDDTAISPRDTQRYYNRVVEKMGRDAADETIELLRYKGTGDVNAASIFECSIIAFRGRGSSRPAIAPLPLALRPQGKPADHAPVVRGVDHVDVAHPHLPEDLHAQRQAEELLASVVGEL